MKTLSTLTTILVFTLVSAFAYAELPDVASLVEQQKDSVVSIQTEVSTNGESFWFRGPGVQQGQGSGFIVDKTGFIITNNHVVQNARAIHVTLNDGSIHPAQLIGVDPKIDVALLKIKTKVALPAVKLGSSSGLKVGEWVVAIGNPFGLDYSVTAGIVSAKSRNIGASLYDDFIQTDASINPGNSGGPLFDMNGNVIGVNTAISRQGQGIGFAVPIDLVKAVMGQLRSKGYVVRGYIGAGLQELDGDLAASFDLPSKHGVLIGQVEDGGPSAASGLRPGDVVTHFGKKRIKDVHNMLLVVAQTKPGKTVAVKYIRDGKKRVSKLRLAERPDTVKPKAIPVKSVTKPTNARLGVKVRALNKKLAQRFGLAKGLIVEQVVANSPASKVLRPGDVIVKVNKTSVSKPKHLEKAMKKTKKGKPIRLQISRDGRALFVAVKI